MGRTGGPDFVTKRKNLFGHESNPCCPSPILVGRRRSKGNHVTNCSRNLLLKLSALCPILTSVFPFRVETGVEALPSATARLDPNQGRQYLYVQALPTSSPSDNRAFKHTKKLNEKSLEYCGQPSCVYFAIYDATAEFEI